MRPSDAFVRPRSVAAADADAAATHLISGPVGMAINNNNNTSGGGVGGVGGVGAPTAPPMMTYFLADENDVDAALEAAAGRDAEGFRAAIHQNVRHIRGKSAVTAAPAAHHVPTPRTAAPAAPALDQQHYNRPAVLSRPATPDQHGPAHAHAQPLSSASHPSGPSSSSLPPVFSPMFSQAGSASQFSTPGPASLSATSSPSSRRHSLSSSFMMDDQFSSGGGGDGALGGSGYDMGSSTGGLEPEAAMAASGLAASGLATAGNSAMLDSGSAPQLIMPSIKMPSRRPFTDVGKSMGRLKVLLAGDTGLGKTSLVKAIVQSCPHIVHADYIAPTSFSLATSRRSSAATVATSSSTAGAGPGAAGARRKSSSRSTHSTHSTHPTHPDLSTLQISEIYASTKPYPSWWNEVSGASGPRRRKSIGDNVLDRNVCFVDTPGFTGSSASPMDIIMPVVEHVEGHVHKLCSNALSDADFVSLVSGDGATTVDVVFYLIADSLKPADIEFLRRLTPLTNVIPLLAQADLLRSDNDNDNDNDDVAVAEAKERIARQLCEANIAPFVFTAPTVDDDGNDDSLSATSAGLLPLPYAVSSTHVSDHDVMDASLLMSPDYVQPLVSSDLARLVEQVFCQDGVSRLRHAAARKIARWRRLSLAVAAEETVHTNVGRPSANYAPPPPPPPSRPQHLYRPLNFGSNSGGGGSGSVLTAPPLGGPSSFALARIADHTQREEQLARIRLANWAAELQRSLDNERAQYERLARGERAVWLTERLGECVQDGTLAAVPPVVQQQQPAYEKGRRPKRSTRRSTMWPAASGKSSLPTSVAHDDPLGLLDVAAGLRTRSLFVLEVLGSLSVLGSIAVWMANHNYHLQLYEWAVAEWTKLWNGEH